MDRDPRYYAHSGPEGLVFTNSCERQAKPVVAQVEAAAQEVFESGLKSLKKPALPGVNQDAKSTDTREPTALRDPSCLLVIEHYYTIPDLMSERYRVGLARVEKLGDILEKLAPRSSDLKPARCPHLSSPGFLGRISDDLRKDLLRYQHRASDFLQKLETPNSCKINQRAAVEDELLTEPESSLANCSSSRFMMGIFRRPNSSMKWIFFIPASSAALPKDKRPSSKSLTASQKRK